MRWQAGADDDIPFMLRLIPCALLVVAAVQMMYLPKSASRLPDIEFKPARSVAHLAVLCLLILAAYALRIANINTYSYWQDEAAQIEAASRANIIEIARTVSARGAGAVPLDHILTSVALRIAGDAEMVIRCLPLIWSTLTVALLYRLGDTLQPGAGKWAALAMCLSPLAVAYAREARFYSLGLMLATAVITWGALAAKGHIRLSFKTWLICAALAVLTIYTHVYSALLWGAGLAIVFLAGDSSRRAQVALWFVSALALAVLAFLPWLVWAMKMPAGFGSGALDTFTERSVHSVLRGLELPSWLPVRRADWLAGLHPFVTTATVLAGILIGLLSKVHRRLTLGLALAYLFGVSGVVLANLVGHYYFAPKQFLFLLPIRSLFIGFALWWIGRYAALLTRFRPAVMLCRVGLAGLLIVSATRVSQLDLYAPSASVAGPAVAYVLQNYDRQRHDIWLVGIVTFAVNFYVQRSGAPPIPWRSDITAESLKAAPPGSLAVVELRPTIKVTPTLESAGFLRVWPSAGQFQRYDLVIYRKEISVEE